MYLFIQLMSYKYNYVMLPIRVIERELHRKSFMSIVLLNLVINNYI